MAVTRPKWSHLATGITAIAGLCVAIAAFFQAWLTSKQVEALQHQTLVSHYTASAGMLESSEIAVRIGAIQALAHLAETHPEQFHLRTIRLLCAFIRQPVEMEPVTRQLRADVQAALDAVIYRSVAAQNIEEQYRHRYADRHRGGQKLLAPPVIDLSGSDLRWGKLFRAQLADAILDGADLSYASGNGAIFSRTSFVETKVQRATFISAKFDRADMVGGDWSGSVLQHSSFVEVQMPNQLIEAHLDWAKLSRAVFAAVDLTGANLENTDLSGAKFRTATRSTFDHRSGAHSSTKLYPVLTQQQLDAAIADPANPPGLPAGIADAMTGRALVWRTDERGSAWAAYQRLVADSGEEASGG